MTTQAEADAGVKWLTAKVDETVPYIMRSRITDRMIFDIVVGVLDEAERVRNSDGKKTRAKKE